MNTPERHKPWVIEWALSLRSRRRVLPMEWFVINWERQVVLGGALGWEADASQQLLITLV